MRAHPDSIVLLVPTPWPLTPDGILLGREQLIEMHPATWSEHLFMRRIEERVYELKVDDGVDTHVPVVKVIIEDPIPEIVDAEQYSHEPLAATERVAIEQHKSLWRLIISDGSKYGMGNALLAAKLMETFCRCHAPAIFLPGSMRLHPVGVVRTLTANLQLPNAITNLFISAWHSEKKMFTRGLTMFGLPELTTEIATGFNGAYFLLLDLATEMLFIKKRFELGAQIEIGYDLFKVMEPNEKIEDPEIPMAGYYGWNRIIQLNK